MHNLFCIESQYLRFSAQKMKSMFICIASFRRLLINFYFYSNTEQYLIHFTSFVKWFCVQKRWLAFESAQNIRFFHPKKFILLLLKTYCSSLNLLFLDKMRELHAKKTFEQKCLDISNITIKTN